VQAAWSWPATACTALAAVEVEVGVEWKWEWNESTSGSGFLGLSSGECLVGLHASELNPLLPFSACAQPMAMIAGQLVDLARSILDEGELS
jgi:hypothetical protein